ncbi:MAG TPA: SGNH/GDSL hydrolase family protein [Prolixibacteraceae bacterium]|nr:SGNH/GDSL hydrolase family protein [Prolixibacteraceae bacterium]
MKKSVLLFALLTLFFAQGNAQNIVSAEFHHHRRSLKNSFLKFQNEKEGRVVFLGGSITHNPGWRDSVMNALQSKFPETSFDFINAGIPSMGSTPGAFRFRRDVLKNGPVDLLFVEAAVNDATNQRNPNEIIRGMEGIVRHAFKANATTDIVMMHFVDPAKMEMYRKNEIPEVLQLHEKVANHYQIPTINLAKEVTSRIDAGEFDWKNDFVDLHPSPFGQNIYFQSIKSYLEKEWATDFSNKKITKVEIPKPVDSYSYGRGYLVEPNPPGTINGWEMVENWRPADGASTRENYTNVSMLIGTYPGQIIKFPFKGNAVGIAVAAGPDAGIIEYSVDGAAWQQLDLFTKWSKNLHLPWYYTLASGLKNRKHMLQMRMADENNRKSKGNICRLRYFYFNGAE